MPRMTSKQAGARKSMEVAPKEMVEIKRTSATIQTVALAKIFLIPVAILTSGYHRQVLRKNLKPSPR